MRQEKPRQPNDRRMHNRRAARARTQLDKKYLDHYSCHRSACVGRNTQSSGEDANTLATSRASEPEPSVFDRGVVDRVHGPLLQHKGRGIGEMLYPGGIGEASTEVIRGAG